MEEGEQETSGQRNAVAPPPLCPVQGRVAAVRSAPLTHGREALRREQGQCRFGHRHSREGGWRRDARERGRRGVRPSSRSPTPDLDTRSSAREDEG